MDKQLKDAGHNFKLQKKLRLLQQNLVRLHLQYAAGLLKLPAGCYLGQNNTFCK